MICEVEVLLCGSAWFCVFLGWLICAWARGVLVVWILWVFGLRSLVIELLVGFYWLVDLLVLWVGIVWFVGWCNMVL